MSIPRLVLHGENPKSRVQVATIRELGTEIPIAVFEVHGTFPSLQFHFMAGGKPWDVIEEAPEGAEEFVLHCVPCPDSPTGN